VTLPRLRRQACAETGVTEDGHDPHLEADRQDGSTAVGEGQRGSPARCDVVRALRARGWIVIALLALALLSEGLRVWRITNHHDLEVFVLAAQRLLAGEDIYADAGPFKAAIEAGTFSIKDNTVVWPYAYAPLIALLFAPAVGLPSSMVQVGWWIVNAGSLLIGSWLVLRAMRPAADPSLRVWVLDEEQGLPLARMEYLPAGLILTLLLVYRFDPAVVAMRLGQIEIVQFLLLAGTVYALREHRDTLAGAALGIAAGLKFFPLALVCLLLWRRRWRAAAWAIGVAAVTIGGSFCVVGLQAVPAYLDYTSIYGIGGVFAAFPLNQSLNGFFSRNLMKNVFSASLGGMDLPWLARGLTLASSALVVMLSAWLTWRPAEKDASQNTDGQRMGLEFSLAVVALLLISPHSQVYTFVWALMALIALSLWLLTKAGSRWWQWAGLAVAYLLLGRSYVFYHPGVTRLVQSHYLFGALLLWALIALALLRERRPAT
jgi:hypothetical protein